MSEARNNTNSKGLGTQRNPTTHGTFARAFARACACVDNDSENSVIDAWLRSRRFTRATFPSKIVITCFFFFFLITMLMVECCNNSVKFFSRLVRKTKKLLLYVGRQYPVSVFHWHFREKESGSVLFGCLRYFITTCLLRFLLLLLGLAFRNK